MEVSSFELSTATPTDAADLAKKSRQASMIPQFTFLQCFAHFLLCLAGQPAWYLTCSSWLLALRRLLSHREKCGVGQVRA